MIVTRRGLGRPVFVSQPILDETKIFPPALAKSLQPFTGRFWKERAVGRNVRWLESEWGRCPNEGELIFSGWLASRKSSQECARLPVVHRKASFKSFLGRHQKCQKKGKKFLKTRLCCFYIMPEDFLKPIRLLFEISIKNLLRGKPIFCNIHKRFRNIVKIGQTFPRNQCNLAFLWKKSI